MVLMPLEFQSDPHRGQVQSRARECSYEERPRSLRGGYRSGKPCSGQCLLRDAFGLGGMEVADDPS